MKGIFSRICFYILILAPLFSVTKKVATIEEQLSTAVRNGEYEAAKKLIDSGANIDYQEPEYGMSALMLALRGERLSDEQLRDGKNLQFAEYLIGRGAKISPPNLRGYGALQYAASCRHNIIALDMHNLSRRSELDRVQNPELCKRVIKKLLPMASQNDLRGRNGFTALHASILSNDLEIVNAVYRVFPYINEHGRSASGLTGDTPLTLAIRLARPGNKVDYNIVKLLIERGADPGAYSNECADGCHNSTPLTLATENGDVAIVKLLVSLNVSIEAPAFSGPLYPGSVYTERTPLMLAIERSHLELADFFLKNGANINQCDNYGFSAVDIAVENSDLNVLKFLIKKGALLKKRTSLPLALHSRAGIIQYDAYSTPLDIAAAKEKYLNEEILAMTETLKRIGPAQRQSYKKQMAELERRVLLMREIRKTISAN